MPIKTGSERVPGLIPAKYDLVALIAGTFLLATFAATCAFTIKPIPFSDWAYYWEAAQGTTSYERGGVLIFALRLLQALTLQPYVTALAMNLTAALVILVLAYRADGRRMGITAILVLIYLLAITPYYSVVQFDLPATALLCGGLYLLAIDPPGPRRGWYVISAVVLVSFAVSSRPQFFLVLLVYGTLLAPVAAVATRFRGLPGPKATIFVVVIVTAAILGFAIDSTLRASAGRTDAVRTNSAVTLYAGLLSSETSRPTCGHWSVQATDDAREDAELPLIQAVSEKLKEQPLRHWLAVMQCKVPNILLPSAYALSWSLGAPSVVARMDASEHAQRLKTWSSRLYRIENLGYRGLLVLIYIFTVIVIMRRIQERQWIAALPPSLWVASYWLVHSVFEIQARYFLSLFLLLPFMTTSGISGLFAKRITPAAGTTTS